MFRDAEQLFYKKALTDEGRMDIFHFPRLNNTFGPFEARRKNFAGTKKSC